MADAKLTALPALAAPSSGDLVYVVDDPSGSATSNKTTIAQLAAVTSKVAQIVSAQSGAVFTTAANIPLDNTIPQIGEGAEITALQVTLTPKNASSTLYLDLSGMAGTAGASWAVFAIFRDSDANAVGAQAYYCDTSTGARAISLGCSVSATATSSTTFKVRAGYGTPSATVTVNGAGGSRLLGGVAMTQLKVTEVLP